MTNSHSGIVSQVEYLDAVMEQWIKLPSGRIIPVIESNQGHPVAATGGTVAVSFAPHDCIIFSDDAGTE